MGLRSYIKNTVKTNVDAKSWLSWNTVKENGRVLQGFVKNLKDTDQKTPVMMTFEDGVKQYNLSEKDISERMKGHFRMAIFCSLLGIAAFLWMCYLLIHSMYIPSLVAFSLFFLMGAYAFREHFTYFQFKQRRLNCTVKEWFTGLWK